MSSVAVQGPQVSLQDTKTCVHDSNAPSQVIQVPIKDTRGSSQGTQMSIQDSQISSQDVQMLIQDSQVSIQETQMSIQDTQVSMEEPIVSILEPKISLLDTNISTQDSQVSNDEPNIPIMEPKMSFQDTGPYTQHSDGIEHYRHSIVHYAVSRADHTSLRQILSQLPVLPKAGDVTTEEESAIAEDAADKVSSVIDRRDVPGRETPLHLAVRLGDAIAVEMLMSAGADWSLQNEQGWSALQEAVCAREEGIAMIITRYYQPMAWAKWCRRLPRITGAMQRMRNFYMEITFHFESSVIPFIGRIAPSDTYRIWKRGSSLRADMTLAGFDGFKIQRSDQSFIFLGDGSEDGKVPPGSLLVLTHKDKEVTNALEGAGIQPSEAEIAQEVAIMSQTNMYRPGIDVTRAELFPQLSWRRQEKTEMVGPWKAKIYDMHNVHLSVKSRRVPGAMTDEELFAAETEAQAELEEDYVNLLNEEEKQQLESALKVDRVSVSDNEDFKSGNNLSDRAENSNAINDNSEDPLASSNETKKRWFGWGRSKSQEFDSRKNSKSHINGETANTEASGSKEFDSSVKRGSLDSNMRLSTGDNTNMDDLSKTGSRSGSLNSKRNSVAASNPSLESEYKKGLRPVLWLTPDFPLKTDELLPLLDLLAHKVKAIRRLRELLTTTLPTGTFPVKVAIPIIPTIRVVVTFNKFEETTSPDEFSTPLSSPVQLDSKAKTSEQAQSSGSWLSWIRNIPDQTNSSKSTTNENHADETDPFSIPKDYTWIDMKEKKRRLKGKVKNKKAKRASLKPQDTAPIVEVDVPSA